MKSKLSSALMIAGMFLAACGGGGGKARSDQQAYETVQEGSAAGVTSTIQGPGETLPPMTDTNADTTTAFALNPNAIPTPQQQAGMSAPPQPTYGGAPVYPSNSPMMSSSPTPAPIARASTPPPQPRPVQQTQQTQPTEVEQPSEPAEPQPTEPAAGPAQTDTTKTDTAPPPESKPAEKPPADDTSGQQAEEPPPPPPPAG